jgi:hypothetical protein
MHLFVFGSVHHDLHFRYVAVTLKYPNESRFDRYELFSDFFNWTMTYRFTFTKLSVLINVIEFIHFQD